MYRLIILLIISANFIPAFSETRTVVTQTPVYPHYGAYYGGDYMPHGLRHHRKTSSMFSDINDLEKYALNKNFIRESDRSRLERLETLAFGAVQEGDYRTRYNNVRNALLSRPKQNYKTSLFRTISDYFGGQVTGYTPPITQTNDYFYSSPFGSSSSVNYSSPWGSRNRVNNYGIGSGSSVRLLD